MFIIEGPDESGKSTFTARFLKRRPDLIYISMLGGRTMSREEMRARTDAFWDGIAYDGFTGFLVERFHPISDCVHRTVFGGDRVFSEIEYLRHVNALVSARTVLIYCRIPCSRVGRIACKTDDTDEWVAEVARRYDGLCAEYDAAMARLTLRGVRVVRYDHTEPGAERLFEEIASCAG